MPPAHLTQYIEWPGAYLHLEKHIGKWYYIIVIKFSFNLVRPMDRGD